eukprot:gnl/TRDRNA2_/TRDRNA2_158416_c0_seq2.p1 gnl/TRDRNA2_/TRDRNA2_158416_c0~~gnl/TRDRNA2_/TRDRNA2_158416_c0_seq2.p1  ORF type:complete len:352 (+),score=31.96 gnl/TRDRNA2_/TRDRNA2_158416_c0_seq2:211-1266(+)
MCNAILLAVVAQANAKELVIRPVQEQGYSLAGKSAANLLDNLADRALTPSCRFEGACLDGTLLGKSSPSSGRVAPATKPKGKLSKTDQVVFGCLVSFLCGCTDVTCYTRHTAFGSMMTGNLLLFAKALGEHGFAVTHAEQRIPLSLYYAVLLTCKHFGLLLYRLVDQISSVSTAAILGPLLVVSMFSVELMTYWYGVAWLPAKWHVWMVAVVYGVQRNVLVPTIDFPLLVMTRAMSNTFDTLFCVFLLKTKARAELAKITTPAALVTSIFSGSLTGALANRFFYGHRVHAFQMTTITTLQVILWLLFERKARLTTITSTTTPLIPISPRPDVGAQPLEGWKLLRSSIDPSK